MPIKKTAKKHSHLPVTVARSDSSLSKSLEEARRKNREVVKIHLVKDKGSLGVQIAGGRGSRKGDIGIFVAGVDLGSPANRDGRIQKGDEILMINGNHLMSVTHQDVVELLKDSGSIVQLVLARKRKQRNKSKPSLSGASSTSDSGSLSSQLSTPGNSPSLLSKQYHSHEHLNATSALSEKSSSATNSPALPQRNIGNSLHVQDAKKPGLPPKPKGVQEPKLSPRKTKAETSKAETSTTQQISLVKGGFGNGLGFSITSGEELHKPKPGIYVKNIFPGGTASIDGRLKEGDEILAVNGESLQGLTHKQALAKIKLIKKGIVTLTAICKTSPSSSPQYEVGLVPPPRKKRTKSPDENRFPQPEDPTDRRGCITMDVVLIKEEGVSLGVGVVCLPTPGKAHETGIYIQLLAPNSPAKKDGKLCVGARVLQVNGQSLCNVTLKDAHNVFGSLKPGLVRMKVARHLNAHESEQEMVNAQELAARLGNQLESPKSRVYIKNKDRTAPRSPSHSAASSGLVKGNSSKNKEYIIPLVSAGESSRSDSDESESSKDKFLKPVATTSRSPSAPEAVGRQDEPVFRAVRPVLRNASSGNRLVKRRAIIVSESEDLAIGLKEKYSNPTERGARKVRHDYDEVTFEHPGSEDKNDQTYTNNDVSNIIGAEGNEELYKTVKHFSLGRPLEMLEIKRFPGEKLGMELNIEHTHENISRTKGVFVQGIRPGGAADRVKGPKMGLAEGDEVLVADGFVLKDAKYEDVKKRLSQLPNTFSVVIARNSGKPNLIGVDDGISEIDLWKQIEIMEMDASLYLNQETSGKEHMEEKLADLWRKIEIDSLIGGVENGVTDDSGNHSLDLILPPVDISPTEHTSDSSKEVTPTTNWVQRKDFRRHSLSDDGSHDYSGAEDDDEDKDFAELELLMLESANSKVKETSDSNLDVSRYFTPAESPRARATSRGEDKSDYETPPNSPVDLEEGTLPVTEIDDLLISENEPSANSDVEEPSRDDPEQEEKSKLVAEFTRSASPKQIFSAHSKSPRLIRRKKPLSDFSAQRTTQLVPKSKVSSRDEVKLLSVEPGCPASVEEQQRAVTSSKDLGEMCEQSMKSPDMDAVIDNIFEGAWPKSSLSSSGDASPRPQEKKTKEEGNVSPIFRPPSDFRDDDMFVEISPLSSPEKKSRNLSSTTLSTSSYDVGDWTVSDTDEDGLSSSDTSPLHRSLKKLTLPRRTVIPLKATQSSSFQSKKLIKADIDFDFEEDSSTTEDEKDATLEEDVFAILPPTEFSEHEEEQKDTKQPQDSTPTSQDSAPTPQDSAPTPQDSAPTPQDSAPTSQDSAPTPQDSTPTSPRLPPDGHEFPEEISCIKNKRKLRKTTSAGQVHDVKKQANHNDQVDGKPQSRSKTKSLKSKDDNRTPLVIPKRAEQKSKQLLIPSPLILSPEDSVFREFSAITEAPPPPEQETMVSKKASLFGDVIRRKSLPASPDGSPSKRKPVSPRSKDLLYNTVLESDGRNERDEVKAIVKDTKCKNPTWVEGNLLDGLKSSKTQAVAKNSGEFLQSKESESMPTSEVRLKQQHDNANTVSSSHIPREQSHIKEKLQRSFQESASKPDWRYSLDGKRKVPSLSEIKKSSSINRIGDDQKLSNDIRSASSLKPSKPVNKTTAEPTDSSLPNSSDITVSSRPPTVSKLKGLSVPKKLSQTSLSIGADQTDHKEDLPQCANNASQLNSKPLHLSTMSNTTSSDVRSRLGETGNSRLGMKKFSWDAKKHERNTPELRTDQKSNEEIKKRIAARLRRLPHGWDDDQKRSAASSVRTDGGMDRDGSTSAFGDTINSKLSFDRTVRSKNKLQAGDNCESVSKKNSHEESSMLDQGDGQNIREASNSRVSVSRSDSDVAGRNELPEDAAETSRDQSIKARKLSSSFDEQDVNENVKIKPLLHPRTKSAMADLKKKQESSLTGSEKYLTGERQLFSKRTKGSECRDTKDIKTDVKGDFDSNNQFLPEKERVPPSMMSSGTSPESLSVQNSKTFEKSKLKREDDICADEMIVPEMDLSTNQEASFSDGATGDGENNRRGVHEFSQDGSQKVVTPVLILESADDPAPLPILPPPLPVSLPPLQGPASPLQVSAPPLPVSPPPMPLSPPPMFLSPVDDVSEDEDVEEGVLQIVVNKDIREPLGIKIEGGADTAKQCIYVKRVLPNSAAKSSGRLRPGDQLLDINGTCMVGITYAEAMDVLVEHVSGPMHMVIARKKLEDSSSLGSDNEVEDLTSELARATCDAMDFTSDIEPNLSPEPFSFTDLPAAFSKQFSSTPDDDVDSDKASQNNARLIPSSPTFSEASTGTQNSDTGLRTTAMPTTPKRLFSKDSRQSPYARKLERSMSESSNSTILLSAGELEKLIEDANQSLEEDDDSNISVIPLFKEDESQSLGLTVAGGVDQEVREITVHKVIPGGLANKDGRIQKGDRLLSVNGVVLKDATHAQALAQLKTKRREMVLVVARPLDLDENEEESSSLEIEMMKTAAGLGFSIEGGKSSPRGDMPITVKKIFTGGAADRSKQLQIEDEIIEVNGRRLGSLTHFEAWTLLKQLPNGVVKLKIRPAMR